MESFLIFLLVVAVIYGGVGVGVMFYNSKQLGNEKDWTTVYKWLPNLIKKLRKK